MSRTPKTPGPYGLTLVENCLGCVHREDGLFCRLSEQAFRHLTSIRQNSFYPQGAVLFVEGETPRGLFVLCSGQAKLAANSSRGRRVTLRLVEAGEVLGLSSVVANGAYPVTAETLTPCQVSFIPRAAFLHLLQTHAEVSVRVAEHLSMELHKAWEQARLLAVAPTSQAKLAQFLMDSAALHGQKTAEGVRVPLNMTQEAVGEIIGASRETVSRDLADFRRRGLIRTRGASVVILQADKLRSLVDS